MRTAVICLKRSVGCPLTSGRSSARYLFVTPPAARKRTNGSGRSTPPTSTHRQVQLQAAPRRGRSPGPPLRSRLGRPADGESVNAAERADSLRPSLGGALSGRSCFLGRRCPTTLPGSNPCWWKPSGHVRRDPNQPKGAPALTQAGKPFPRETADVFVEVPLGRWCRLQDSNL